MNRVLLRHLRTHGGNNPESGACDIIRVALPQWSPRQEHLTRRPLLTESGPQYQHPALPAPLSCPGPNTHTHTQFNINHLMWRHGTPLSSQGIKWVSDFLSSCIGIWGFCLRCHRALTHPFMFRLDPRGYNRVSEAIRLIWSGCWHWGLSEWMHDSCGGTRVSR